MTRLRELALVVGLAHLPFGFALDVQVDPVDGPLVLPELVDTVLDDWRSAGVDVDLVDRSVRVRYGAADLFGPDAIVWVVARPDDDVDYEVLVNPVADGVRAALIPALGVVLGGVLGEGALDPRVVPDAPRAPTAADALAVEARASGVEGDVDGDGRVTFEDLLAVAAAYGRQGVNLTEDLDGDGIVGDGDLDVLRTHYTFTDPDDPEADAVADPSENPEDEETAPVPGDDGPGAEPDEDLDLDEPEPEAP